MTLGTFTEEFQVNFHIINLCSRLQFFFFFISVAYQVTNLFFFTKSLNWEFPKTSNGCKSLVQPPGMNLTMMPFFFIFFKMIPFGVQQKHQTHTSQAVLELNLRSHTFCWYTAEELCQQIYTLYLRWTNDFRSNEHPILSENEQTSGYIVVFYPGTTAEAEKFFPDIEHVGRAVFCLLSFSPLISTCFSPEI